jgi:hypothetical protein
MVSYEHQKPIKINTIIDWLNQKHKSNIEKLPICSEALYKDAWLAGFIDADGSFAIRQIKKSETTKKQIECQFILVQRTVYPKTEPSYAGILNLVASFLCVKLNILKARNPKAQDQYKIKVSCSKSKAKLQVYLNKYPLLSTTLLDYGAWCSADDLMLQKCHYTEQGGGGGRKKINKIKKSMNNSRTNYN